MAMSEKEKRNDRINLQLKMMKTSFLLDVVQEARKGEEILTRLIKTLP